MLSADKCLETDYLAGVHVHLGLVMQHELSMGKANSDALYALVLPAQATVLFRFEKVVPVLTRQFGLVHGLVGLPQKLIRIHLFRLWVEGRRSNNLVQTLGTICSFVAVYDGNGLQFFGNSINEDDIPH